MIDVEVFVLPDEWKFYQCELRFGDNCGVCVAGEPFGSVATPTITVDVVTKRGHVTLYLDASEASEMWTALGYAIRTASGSDPVPAKFIE